MMDEGDSGEAARQDEGRGRSDEGVQREEKCTRAGETVAEDSHAQSRGLRKRATRQDAGEPSPITPPSGRRGGAGTRARQQSGGQALAGQARSMSVRLLQMLVLFAVGLVLASLFALVVCWLFFPVSTPSIAGPRAIASLETVMLGGAEQSILIRAEDSSKPIILLLQGGPGLPLMPFRSGFAALEKDFVVVYWDQYGTGKSCEWSTFLASTPTPTPVPSVHPVESHRPRHFHFDDENDDGVSEEKRRANSRRRCQRCQVDDRFGEDEDLGWGPKRSMHLASIIQDTEELIHYLKRRFHQPSIVLIAHDSGSALAMHAAHHLGPEHVRSVVLIAPLVDFEMQHQYAHEWALDRARRERHYAALSQLENDLKLPLANASQLLKLRRLIADLGGDIYSKGGNRDFVLKLLHFVFAASEYGIGEKLSLLLCGVQSLAHQFGELKRVNLTQQIPEINVPVLMTCGKFDRLAPCAIVEDYFNTLRINDSRSAKESEAQHQDSDTGHEGADQDARKKLIVLPKSAHWPFIEEEHEYFIDQLRDHMWV